MKAGLLPLLALLALLAGCSSHPIPEQFLPLESLNQKPLGLGHSVTTIYNTVWVNDVEEYLKRKPEWSPLYVGDMLHERIHSIRMGNIFGTISFLWNYVFDKDFMREEECIPWYFELIYLRSKGIIKPPPYTANFLMGYENLDGPMFETKEEALQWVMDAYSGKWKPNISEEEWAFYYTDLLEAIKGK
jgi:hypothetical protein